MSDKLVKHVATLREKISITKSRIDELESGVVPLPLETALATADKYIAGLAADATRAFNATVDAMAYAERDDGQHLIAHQGHAAGAVIVRFGGVVGLIALLNPESLRTRMHARLREHYGQLPKPMTPAQQQAAIVTLQADLLELEKADYTATEELRTTGYPVDHRHDINPAVLLGVA
jgi:hypothetical protein